MASQQQKQQQQQSGPPYMQPTAQLGGRPLLIPDVPISAVLVFLFVCSAATHMTIFQLNRKREHKFIFSVLLFGFSMARIATLIMRIVWAAKPTNVRVAIAAGILTQAGVVLLFVINLFFTERIMLAYHPRMRNWMFVSWVLRVLVTLVIVMILMAITVTVHSLYTLDPNARRMDRDVQLFAGTFLAVLAFLPIPITIIAVMVPRSNAKEKFGTGHLRTKVALLLFTAALLSLGAGFRIGSNYAAPPANDPQWYDHKAAFYVINFGIELIVSFTYAIVRFDRRFHVPNRVKKGDNESGEESDQRRFTGELQTETEVFGSGDKTRRSVDGSGTDVDPRTDNEDVEKGQRGQKA